MAASVGGRASPQVRVQVVGRFAVQRDGVPVAGPDLGSRKARVLLKLLTVERAHAVSVDRIIEVLWGEAAPAGPGENIATLVSRLRRTLGAGIVDGGRDGYRLGQPPAVRTDLDEAARWAAEAERRSAAAEHALALGAAERAHEVLRGGAVLEDEGSAEWAEPARAEHGELTGRVLRILADAALATGDLEVAARTSAQAVSDDPYDERARRTLMRAHAARGEPARALAAYAELRQLLESELGADPAAQTQELYLSVLREQELPAGDAAPARARGRRDAAGLAGRAEELRRLRAAWQDAAAGRPGLTVVSGEAGVGKTRLVEELTEIAAATGGIVLAARCYETERSLFLQPFVEAIAAAVRTMPPARLRDLSGDHAALLSRLVPDVAAVLGPSPADRPAAADVERRRAFEAVTGLTRALAAHGPVLLSLDDLQNAGRATVELLHYLVRHVPLSRVLAVATVRAEEGADILDALADVAAWIELGPLPAGAVATLAAAAGQAGLADSIFRRTRGHALFVVETLRALAAGNSGIPVSLEAAVLARVRRAGRAVETVLRASAVLGASFDPETVAGLVGEAAPTVIATCADAHAARLLAVAGRDYEFANDLIREVLYATTPAPTRLAYHRRAADLLTHRPEAMAAHASAAEDWPRAARGWLLAGEEALARAAAADAAGLLSRSLAAAARAGDREVQARALLVRGRAKEALSEFDGAVSDIEAAVTISREAGDQRLEVAALIALGGDPRMAVGRPVAEAIEPLERGLSISMALSDRAMEATLRARLAILAANGLRFDEAIRQGSLAVRAARASGDEEALAAALDGQKTSVAYIGEIDALLPVIAELEPLLRRLGDAYRLHWVVFESSFPALAAGDWSAAAGRIKAAIDLHRRSGYGAYAAWYVALLGTIERLQGRYDDAIEIGRRGVALSEEAPHAWTAAVAGSALGTTLLEAGDRDQAISVLERARIAAQQNGAEAILLRCLAPLAEATGSPDVLAEAAALLQGIRAPDGSAFLSGDGCYLAVARAWLAAGEPERARAVLAPLLAAAARVPWVAPLAAASLVDGRAAMTLGRRGQAAAALERAAELGRRHGLAAITREAAEALG